jgi:3-methyladenine DNA glycosylase AlkD
MNLIGELESIFKDYAHDQKARWQEAYMKNQFRFLGIPKPLRAKLEKEIFKLYPLSNHEELIEITKLLWHKSEREFQYAACELIYHHKKLWDLSTLNIFEYMIRTKSWWDTVDNIAARLVGTLVFNYPELIANIDQWICDENLWIRRSALLFQLRWKEQTDEQRLFSFCIKTMHEKDFFIRKAIGWVLREYSKTNPLSIRAFVDTHRNDLSTLSIREGSKYI